MATSIAKAIVEKVLDLMSVELPSENDNSANFDFTVEVDGQGIDVELTAQYESERFIATEFLGAVDYGQRVELKSISNLFLGFEEEEGQSFSEAAVEKEINTSLYFGVWVN